MAIGPPSGDIDDFDAAGVGGASVDAGAGAACFQPGLTHVTFGHDAAIGLERWHRVGAVSGAVLAANAVIGVMLHYAVVELGISARWTPFQTGRLEKVVAGQRQMEALRGGE